MCDLYTEYLESEETDLEYFDWLDNQTLLRSRDRKIEEANNEIDNLLSKAKENIIKYINMQFHEDISEFINSLSKQQILDIQDHLYDFKEFEELKKYLQKSKE